MTVRLEININDEAAAYLRERAEAEGISLTDAQRKIYGESKYIYDAIQAGDEIILRRRKRRWHWHRTDYRLHLAP